MRWPEKSVRPVLKSACRADSEEIQSRRTGAGEESDREFSEKICAVDKVRCRKVHVERCDSRHAEPERGQ
eukprot:COSAG02_NODE_607_length_19608_cov_33.568968_8_plen_70_part_00